MTERWTSAECAAAWGVKPATWLGYVSRGQAPQPLSAPDAQGRRQWDAAAVRGYPRPGVGRSRTGAGPEAKALLAQMREVAERMEELRGRQRELLSAGKGQGLEISAMAKALGISRQTAYGWLAD
ncbi:hypothetical protein [Pseudonocardia adelaidensis]|uniref:Homeodomain-like domain-containing protein n=1 Tax=Pseudonocardia adelaidensis TaxID=648754 RepID=A0ABP9NUZ3_9PSEU